MSKFRTNKGDWKFMVICIWLSPPPLNNDKELDGMVHLERWYYNEEKERKAIEYMIKKIAGDKPLFKGQFGKFEAYVDQMAIAEGSIFGEALKQWFEQDNIRKVLGE